MPSSERSPTHPSHSHSHDASSSPRSSIFDAPEVLRGDEVEHTLSTGAPETHPGLATASSASSLADHPLASASPTHEKNPQPARSAYSLSAAVPTGGKFAAFGTDPVGVVGKDLPREMVRVERDYTGGEVWQFFPSYPLELEGRITPTDFQYAINEINARLLSAFALWPAALDHTLAILTLYILPLIRKSHFERELEKLDRTIDVLNRDIFNLAGLNVLNPRSVAFLFLEIEYY